MSVRVTLEGSFEVEELTFKLFDFVGEFCDLGMVVGMAGEVVNADALPVDGSGKETGFKRFSVSHSVGTVGDDPVS